MHRHNIRELIHSEIVNGLLSFVNIINVFIFDHSENHLYDIANFNNVYDNNQLKSNYTF